MEKYFLRYKNTEYVRSFKDKYEVIDYAKSAFEDILYDFYNDLPKVEQEEITTRYATIDKFFSNFVDNWNKYAIQYGYTAITQEEKEKIISNKNARIINENLKYEQEFDNILQEYLRKQKNDTERDIPYPRWKWRLLISIINLSLTFLKFINTLISVKCAFFFCVIL